MTLARIVLGLSLAVGAVACSSSSDEDAAAGTAAAQNLTSDEAEAVVRAYYASTRAEDPGTALAPIVADGAVLSAPSVKLLKGTPEITGKEAFVKAVAGGSFLLKNVTVREIIPRDEHLVVSRIDLPLPNGDVLTQVEFFALENGKITRLDSYYDATRFIAALPAIAIERLKTALGI